MTIKLNSPLAPDLTKLSKYLSQVNDSGWYTNFGPLHQQLTQRLEEFLGVENLLLVSNGTFALQVAAKVLQVEHALTTPFSFVATSSALLWQKMDVSFCDIDADSYNLSPKAVQKALRQESFDGIVATHVYGNPCDVKAFEALRQQHQFKVIYDAAHAFGVNVGGSSVLNFGDASTLSFHATKIFHTVEGGAIVFKHRDDFEHAKELINFGIQSNGSLGQPGINAKLNEYQCAVGLTLLDEIDVVIAHRASLLFQYRNAFNGVVDMPKWHESASYNGAYMPIYVEDKDQIKLQHALDKNRIQYRRYFTPSLDLAYPNQRSFGCIESQKKAKGVFCLPLHAYMVKVDVSKVVSVVKDALSQ